MRSHLAVSDDPVFFAGPEGSTGIPTVSILGTVAEAADLDSLPGIRSEDIGVHIIDTVAGRRSRSPTDLKYLVTLGLKTERLKYPGASLLASPPPPNPPGTQCGLRNSNGVGANTQVEVGLFRMNIILLRCFLI